MTDIFLAYAGADRDRVALLASALEAAGYAVWWDKALAPGAQFATEAEAALAHAKAVIVAWSQHSVDHGWTLDTAAVGRSRDVLCAVALDATPPPLGFRQHDAISFVGWSGDVSAPAFVVLRDRLRPMLEAPRPQGAGSAPLGIAATPPPRPPSQRSRWIIAGAVIVAAGLGLAALLSGRPGLPLPSPSPPAAEARGGYGLAPEDLAGFGAQDLIRIALSLGGIAEIEEGAGRQDPLALGLSCLAFGYGEGVPADPDMARDRCEAARSAGSSLGGVMLARLAENGQAGLTPEEAPAFLEQAAAAGDPRAMTELARIALRADPPEPDRAANLARRAAEMGHHPAELLYGWMFETGAAGPVDYAQAYFWYDAAAQKAYPPGLAAAGRLLEAGQGVPADAARARALYTEAANRGDGEANYRLALMLEQGLGGSQEPERAVTLMRAAVAAGYEGAEEALARMEAPAAAPAPAPAAAPPATP